MPEQSKYILAKTLSGIFHPLLLPAYLSFGLLFLPRFAFGVASAMRWQVMTIVILTFVILPVSILYFLEKYGKISSIQLTERRERFFPMFLVAISYIIGLRLLHIIHAPGTLIMLMQGVCLSIIFVALVSIVWKISAHTTASGGALGIVILLSIIYRTDFSSLAAFITLFAGAVGWSRLYLNHHTRKQVNYGFMAGFSTMIISFLLHAIL